MNKLFSTLKKYSKELALYLLYATAGLAFLYYVGNFANAFLPVIGNLLLMFVEISLWIITPVLLTAGKNDLAKVVMRPIFIYWTIATIFGFLEDCLLVSGKADGIVIAIGVFEFFIACAFIVLSVFTILGFAQKKTAYKKLALLIFCGSLFFYIIVFALRVANAAGAARWNDYFGIIYKYLVLPFGMFFMALYFEFKLDDMVFVKEKPKAAPAAAKETEAKEPAPTEKEAAPAEETKAPAEETSEIVAEETAVPEKKAPAKKKAE